MSPHVGNFQSACIIKFQSLFNKIGIVHFDAVGSTEIILLYFYISGFFSIWPFMGLGAQ